MRALIQINSPIVACRNILGLPALIRTLMALRRAGCQKIAIVCKEATIFPSLLKKYGLDKTTHVMSLVPKNLKDFLVLSGEVHYDPDFIKWMVQGNVNFPDPYYKEVTSSWWGPLEGPHAVEWAEEKLFKIINDKREGLVERSFNKPITTFFSKILANTHRSANQVSLSALLMALFSCFLLYQNNYGWRLLGVLAMFLFLIFSETDGELAQIKLQLNNKGVWVNRLVNDISVNLLIAGLFLGIYQSNHDSIYISVGFLLLLLNLLSVLMTYYHLVKRHSKKNPWFEILSRYLKKDLLVAVMLVLLVADLRVFLFWTVGLMSAISFITHLTSFVMVVMRKVKRGIEV